jgi:hypothetical protein
MGGATFSKIVLFVSCPHSEKQQTIDATSAEQTNLKFCILLAYAVTTMERQ